MEAFYLIPIFEKIFGSEYMQIIDIIAKYIMDDDYHIVKDSIRTSYDWRTIKYHNMYKRECKFKVNIIYKKTQICGNEYQFKLLHEKIKELLYPKRKDNFYDFMTKVENRYMEGYTLTSKYNNYIACVSDYDVNMDIHNNRNYHIITIYISHGLYLGIKPKYDLTYLIMEN